MARELIEEYPSSEYPVSIRCMRPEPGTLAQAEEVYRAKGPEMIKAYEGEILIEFGGKIIKVRPGEGAFIKKNQIHRIAAESEAMYYSIVFDPEFVIRKHARSPMTKKYYDDINETTEVSVIHLDPERMRDENSLNRLEEIISANTQMKPGFELTTLGNLALLWVSLLERFLGSEEKYTGKNVPSRDELRVMKAKEFIAQNYADNITLKDIADKIHVTTNECCRAFKRVTGISPVEHLVRRRIFEAARILYKDPLAADSFSELAINVGFNTISYFNRMFKRYMHLTPSEYRRMLKQDGKSADEHYRELERTLD